MSSRVRAYRCGDLRPHQELRRDRGLRVGATIADAIALWTNRGVEYGTPWPPRVFEGTVESGDVLSTDAHSMNVRAMFIERELAFGEVFGARADDLVKFVDELDQTRWFRPDARAGADARLAELVAEHYAALADYGVAQARPVRIVRTWHEARDLYDTVEARPEAANTAIKAVTVVPGGTTEEITLQTAEARVARSAFFGAWAAAWLEAGRSATTGIHALPLLMSASNGREDHLRIASAARTVDGLVKALGAAREPAWRAGWDVAYELFTRARDDIPDAETIYAPAVAAARHTFAHEAPTRPLHSLDCEVCVSASEAREEIVATFILHTCITVWTVAMKAAQTAAWRSSYLVRALPKADPWRPLCEIWHMGGWPLGASRNAFVVFLPEPKN